MLKSQFMSFYKGTPYETGASECYDAIEKALFEQGILSRNTLIGALATVRIEAGKTYTPVRENLNYSAAALMRVFPRSFPTLEIANQYEIQPEKIANRVYANRMGNGDEASGDGWKYRGANYLQNTGKDNWDMVGMTPENCLDPIIGAKSVAIYFKKNNVYKACENQDWQRVRTLVNGGLNGWQDFKRVVDEFIRVTK
jgi:Predicted chitinase